MGALFCGCEKKEIDASVPDFEAKQPTQQKQNLLTADQSVEICIFCILLLLQKF